MKAIPAQGTQARVAVAAGGKVPILWLLIPFALTGFLSGGAPVARNLPEGNTAPVSVRDNVVITTVCDNYAVQGGLTTQWGFAAVAMTPEVNILFDTGSDGHVLLSNMKKLNIDPKDINKVVISHVHMDHLGGLAEFLQANSAVRIYIPASFPDSIRHAIVSSGAQYQDVAGAVEIDEGIYTTGEMGAQPREQSLIIDTSEGLVVVTGCAHPGIVNVVRRATEVAPHKPIALVIGGFHLQSASAAELDKIMEDFRRLRVKKVAPSHCSGDRARARFHAEYRNDYIAGGAGNVLAFREAE